MIGQTNCEWIAITARATHTQTNMYSYKRAVIPTLLTESYALTAATTPRPPLPPPNTGAGGRLGFLMYLWTVRDTATK